MRNSSRDNSSIDFAYMPQYELEAPAQNEIVRMPLLHHNTSPNRNAAQQEFVETVVRPQITTTAANGTHIESPSAMSEVTDNQTIDLNPFDLTTTVTNAASRMTGMPVEELKEPGMLRQLWNGLLDDMVGNKVAKAA
ncbi:hypothetical protein MMC28_002982 [Mycoblastus sanguinarius]|nr:hypothetical protein [Mycoblastus sanguinarius]